MHNILLMDVLLMENILLTDNVLLMDNLHICSCIIVFVSVALDGIHYLDFNELVDGH